MSVTIQVLGDGILVHRLEGHGIEKVSPGGIIMPATREAKAKTKSDYFRARVLAMGPDARRAYAEGELRPGDEVLVHTWGSEFNGNPNRRDGEKLYTGAPSPYGLFIRPDDIICAVDPGPTAEPDPFPEGSPYR